MSRESPPPYAGDPGLWAENLNDYLERSKSVIPRLTANDRASEDGIFLWDSTGYPVVSKNGEFRQIVLADGRGDFVITSDVTFDGSTVETLSWSEVGTSQGITLSPSGTDITFSEPGYYLASFSAQIYSTSSSTIDFAFWSEINGFGANTMRNALHQSGASLVVSRTAVFSITTSNVSNNHALQAKAFCTSDKGTLESFLSNSLGKGEPASPAATLSVFRLHQ